MSPEHQALRAALPSPATVPELRRLARRWLVAHKASPPETILATVDGLFAGDAHVEKTLAALIIGYSQAARRAATPARVDAWLDRVVGWDEVDALCANAFQADDFLADWPLWSAWLRRLAADANIHKRRASLVLLTGPVRGSDDARLAELAFANIAALQDERPILTAKAVSWLLRNLIARHRGAVVSYLEAHRAALPAIAVREATNKLVTGRKTPARGRAGARGG
jgi:3-methyladenine DNA glycosylase AlkD